MKSERCAWQGRIRLGTKPGKLGYLGHKGDGIGDPTLGIHSASSLTVRPQSFATLSTPLVWPSRKKFKHGTNLWMGFQSTDVACTSRVYVSMNLGHWKSRKEIREVNAGGEANY